MSSTLRNKLPNQAVTEAVSAGGAFQNAHVVDKGDPRIDGPYLDDIRAAQEDEYRKQRKAAVSQVRDEDTQKKKDVPFEDFRAASQIQHDENRYHEEKTVEESVKAHVKKTPKTPVEKAGQENRVLPPTKSKKAKVKKADKFSKGKTDGDTPNLKVQQKKAKDVSDRPTQPSNETKPTETVPSARPEVTTDPQVVKSAAKKPSVAKRPQAEKTAAKKAEAKTAPTSRVDDREQGAVVPTLLLPKEARKK